MNTNERESERKSGMQIWNASEAPHFIRVHWRPFAVDLNSYGRIQSTLLRISPSDTRVLSSWPERTSPVDRITRPLVASVVME